MILTPGKVPLAAWRAIAGGAAFSLDPAAMPVVAASADAVEAIVAVGKPVYGINTGFGKLASVRTPSRSLGSKRRSGTRSVSSGSSRLPPTS